MNSTLGVGTVSSRSVRYRNRFARPLDRGTGAPTGGRQGNYAHRSCPECGKSCPRERVRTRTLHDLGDPLGRRPRDIQLTYSQHHCARCRHSFNADMSDYALPKSHYTHRVVSLAVRLVVEDGLPYQAASWHLWRDHRVFVPFATIQNWVEAGGKKGG